MRIFIKFRILTTIFILTSVFSLANAKTPSSSIVEANNCHSILYSFITPNPRTFIFSAEDFHKHTTLHIQRVVALGEYLIDRYPQEFPNLDPKIVRKFLKNHDQAKVNEAYTPKNELALYKQLYLFFGKKTEQLSRKQLTRRKVLIAKVNKIDKQVAMSFFERHNLIDRNGNLNEVARELLRIEKLADLVDRGMNKVTSEEFARKMKPASDMFQRRERKLSKKLELRYKRIIKGLDWEN